MTTPPHPFSTGLAALTALSVASAWSAGQLARAEPRPPSRLATPPARSPNSPALHEPGHEPAAPPAQPGETAYERDSPQVHSYAGAPKTCAAAPGSVASSVAVLGGLITRLQGLYLVPAPPELMPYSVYPIEEVWLWQSSERVELSYELPPLLVGHSSTVAFSGEPNDRRLQLTGTAGRSNCVLSAASWSCQERFDGPDVDLDGVRLAAAGRSPEEVSARLELSRRFSTDPIGILLLVPPAAPPSAPEPGVAGGADAGASPADAGPAALDGPNTAAPACPDATTLREADAGAPCPSNTDVAIDAGSALASPPEPRAAPRGELA